MPDISKVNETIAEDRINRIRELQESMDSHFEEMHNEIIKMKADDKKLIEELKARTDKSIEESKARTDKSIEESKARTDKSIEELKAYDKKLIEESEARMQEYINNLMEESEARMQEYSNNLIEESKTRMNASFLKIDENHKNRITQVKSDEKNNDIANQPTNVKSLPQNPTTPQTTHQSEGKKENNVVDLESTQEAALEKIQSLIRGNENASTGIINMNKLLKDHDNYSNGKKLTTVDLLNGLKKLAKERTSFSFFSLPSFSSVSSFFSSLMSLGRKKWVTDLYTALNDMEYPNKLDDVKKLLGKLGNINPDNSANIDETNNKEGSKGYTFSQNTSDSAKKHN